MSVLLFKSVWGAVAALALGGAALAPTLPGPIAALGGFDQAAVAEIPAAAMGLVQGLRQASREDDFATGSIGPTRPTSREPMAPTYPAARAGLAKAARPDLAAFAAAAGRARFGELALAGVGDPLQRAALQWIALRFAARPAYERLAAFGAAHPDWPAMDWLRETQEGQLYDMRLEPRAVIAMFAGDAPHTPPGKLAYARALIAVGRSEEAGAMLRAMWRASDLNGWTQGVALKEFGALLTRADHKFRADRLFYAGAFAPSLRAAALAGPDVLALARLRIEAWRAPPSEIFAAAAPPNLRGDPSLLLAKAHALRRAERPLQAAAALAAAPQDSEGLVDPSAWWAERRKVARQLLDLGEAAKAYAVCVDGAAAAADSQVDAAFLAGWIALRQLRDAPAAAVLFERSARRAASPLSVARANYWRGEAADAQGSPGDADSFYAAAAAYPATFYGQLAGKKIAPEALALDAPASVAVGDARAEAVRVVELLYAAGLDAMARPLAFDAARALNDEAQLGALAEVVGARQDALGSVGVGKIATARGFPLDAAAFPAFGVPEFAPLANSADRASVFAVARQESEFTPQARSNMGARGLMQILPSTAWETARRAGVPFSYARFLADPAYNAQIGARYLGELRVEQGGSDILAFAAYNAGGGRVAQWIKAYGDPAKGEIDPVDWLERLPYDETREYVQRVSENLGVYRARFARNAPGSELRLADGRGRRGE